MMAVGSLHSYPYAMNNLKLAYNDSISGHFWLWFLTIVLDTREARFDSDPRLHDL